MPGRSLLETGKYSLPDLGNRCGGNHLLAKGTNKAIVSLKTLLEFLATATAILMMTECFDLVRDKVSADVKSEPFS
jgi:hypothetical protein